MANGGELFTTQQAGTIRQGHFILINDRPCEVDEVVDASDRGRRPSWCSFVGYDIFSRQKHISRDFSPRHKCKVPYVNSSDYRLFHVSDEGSVHLLNGAAGEVKVFHLTDQAFLERIKAKLEADRDAVGRHHVMTVLSAMGEEQICGFKTVNPIFP